MKRKKRVTLRKKLQWRCEYIVFRLFACVIELLPVRRIDALSRGLAWAFMHLLPRRWTRYEVARSNLEGAFGERYSAEEIDDIIERMWAHLFRMVAEIIQFPRKVRLENCREVIVFRNRKAAVSALCSGRTVLLLGGHFGNWEASMVTFGVFGFQMGVVARKLTNPYLHNWFVAAREATGHRLLLKRGGWDGMVDLLESGGTLGLLFDQDAGKRGIFVDFFGRPASTFRSIALMAREYNAIIIVGYGRRLPDDFANCRWSRFEIGCDEIIDTADVHCDDEVLEITQRMTRALERTIERAPEQYFWVHRRWDTPPPARARRKAA